MGGGVGENSNEGGGGVLLLYGAVVLGFSIFKVGPSAALRVAFIPVRVAAWLGLGRWLLDDSDDHLGQGLNPVIWASTRSVNADYRGRNEKSN